MALMPPPTVLPPEAKGAWAWAWAWAAPTARPVASRVERAKRFMAVSPGPAGRDRPRLAGGDCAAGVGRPCFLRDSAEAPAARACGRPHDAMGDRSRTPGAAAE